jgi:hypothetical protein
VLTLEVPRRMAVGLLWDSIQPFPAQLCKTRARAFPYVVDGTTLSSCGLDGVQGVECSMPGAARSNSAEELLEIASAHQ